MDGVGGRPVNDFDRDNAWQRRMRDEILGPAFYERYSSRGKYVFVNKGRLADLLQRQFSVDTIIQADDGRAICVEEKIVRWPSSGKAHTAFALETESCTKPGREAPGWMRYGQADYLLWAFETMDHDLDCYVIDFPKLQAWFGMVQENYPRFGPLPTLNGTQGRVVPIVDVMRNVPTKRYLVKRPARVEAIT